MAAPRNDLISVMQSMAKVASKKFGYQINVYTDYLNRKVIFDAPKQNCSVELSREQVQSVEGKKLIELISETLKRLDLRVRSNAMYDLMTYTTGTVSISSASTASFYRVPAITFDPDQPVRMWTYPNVEAVFKKTKKPKKREEKNETPKRAIMLEGDE